MIVHDWGEIAYVTANRQMHALHVKAQQDAQNHLILCSHPAVFTVGSDEQRHFNVPTVQSDRGGSVTCHSRGQNIFYFCFQVKQPARFYKKVLEAFESFFMKNLPAVRYDKNKPGFYIQNRKIASLGFRYSRGVSLHGVALNVDVDLDFHSLVSPCNLANIVPTSLKNEGLILTSEEVNEQMVHFIGKYFEDAV
ncbi:lipoyl(octanoyl) transferase LipB [Sulfurimonas sp. ST-27]|uniref:lipoyl(octanoyl) transferase LipB n=1 Tax=unclassified Sulfurimonas TaxID=2623549 RepID=UPI003AB37451